MRRDILSTLCYIFRNNENAKNSFRTGGGFIWTVAVLDGIGRCMQQASLINKTENEDLDLFTFLKTLLYTLSVVLTGNVANQTYFRDDIHFSTLSETLQSCHFIEGQRAVELCDSLLNMGVKGTWPPSCSKHPPPLVLPPPWEPQFTPATDADHSSQIQTQVSACLNCKESLFIENPELIKLIIQLIGSATKRSTNTVNHSFYVHVMKELSFLADILPSNQQKLSSVGIVGDILDNFRDTLLESNRYMNL